jgi:hypothetical protein
MTIKVDDLLAQMLEAAKAAFSKDWPAVKEHAETELKGIAEGIALVERLRIQGKISQQQAKLLMKMKKNTAQIVLLTIKGMELVAVENALNASLKVVKDNVNQALGFSLL